MFYRTRDRILLDGTIIINNIRFWKKNIILLRSPNEKLYKLCNMRECYSRRNAYIRYFLPQYDLSLVLFFIEKKRAAEKSIKMTYKPFSKCELQQAFVRKE